jgi:hypothetical protein
MTMTAPKKPNSPPTLIAISDNYKRLHRCAIHAQHLAFALCAIAVALAFTRVASMQVIAVVVIAVGLGLFQLDRRWSRQSRKILDANVLMRNVMLTNERDLQWIAWFCYIEPRAAAWLQSHRPNGQFTTHDFVKLYALKTQDEIDAAYAPPYNGNTEARFEDLDIRRAKERT